MNMIAACLAALSLSAPHGHAHPPAAHKEYLSIVLRNDTKAPVSYSLCWGPHGSYVNFTLSPGGQRIHAITAPARPVGVHIRYDRDLRFGRVDPAGQHLMPARVKDRHHGAALRFQTVHNGHNLWIGP